MSEISFSTTAEIGVAALARAAGAVFQDVPYEHEPFPLPTPAGVARGGGRQSVGRPAPPRRGQRAYLADFGVVPEFRRRGIGRRLIEVFLEEVRRTGARTVELAADAGKTAHPAVRIYEGAGFRTVRNLAALTGSAGEVALVNAAVEVRPCEVDAVVNWFGGERSTKPLWERELSSLLAEADARALLAVRGGGGRASVSSSCCTWG